MQTQPTTPFGRRSLSLAMVASQAATENFAARPAASETVVHKWRLFRALTEAKSHSASPTARCRCCMRCCRFHQETALTLPAGDLRGGAKLIRPVPASSCSHPTRNSRSAPMAWRRRRCAGISPASSRPGLIIRRDSPNGKRFARRGQGGEIEDAFGFDLTPLVARAEEIENLAEEVRAENRAMAAAAREASR